MMPSTKLLAGKSTNKANGYAEVAGYGFVKENNQSNIMIYYFFNLLKINNNSSINITNYITFMFGNIS